MRASTVSILLQLGVLAFGQNLAGLPVCAQTAAIAAATNSGCGLADVFCLCNNAGFINSLKAIISGSCSGSDQQTACTWGNSACAPYGAGIDCSAKSASTTSGEVTASAAAASSASQAQSSVETSSASDSGTLSSSETNTIAISATASSMGANTSGMGSTITDSMTSSVTTMSTGIILANGTAACTYGCNNVTLAATSMVSRTGSAPTSQYTGAASTAARHCGVIGVLFAIASLLVIF